MSQCTLLVILLISLCWLQIFQLAESAESFISIPSDSTKLEISGGYIPPPHSFPYMASLYIIITNTTDPNDYLGSQCAGALISSKYVLTAAHCLYEPSFRVVFIEVTLGAHDLSAPEKESQKFIVSNFKMHPNLTSTRLNDIALLELDREVILRPGIVETINLPKKSDAGKNYVNQTGYISGWGLLQLKNRTSTEILHAAKVTVGNCKLSSKICTNGTSTAPNVAPCKGDSGGPLVVNGVAIGIVSTGRSPCEAPNNPTFYTRIDQFLDFIEDNSDVIVQA